MCRDKASYWRLCPVFINTRRADFAEYIFVFHSHLPDTAKKQKVISSTGTLRFSWKMGRKTCKVLRTSHFISALALALGRDPKETSVIHFCLSVATFNE